MAFSVPYISILVALILAFGAYSDIPTTVDEFFVFALPRIPLTWIHIVCYHSYWLLSFYIYPIKNYLGMNTFEDCLESDSNDMRIVVTTLKSGTVFSNAIGNELFRICGMTASISRPANTNEWPDILRPPPEYEADIYIALGNPMFWEDYLTFDFNKNKNLKCAVIMRNPYSRLISLYKYARDYGDTGIFKYSRQLSDLSTVEERFKKLWNNLGKKVMKDSHVPIYAAVQRGCAQMRLDKMMNTSKEYDEAMITMMDAFQIKSQPRDKLLQAFAKHDLNRKTKEQRDANSHVSGKSMEKGELDKVKRLIYASKEVHDMLQPQCAELGYDCSLDNFYKGK